MYPLIDVRSLARALDSQTSGAAGRPIVLDVRWRLGGPPGIEAYRAGHVPGAVFLDLDRELCGAPGAGGRHPLPSAEMFQDTMRRAGVGAGRPVVVYDEADATAAARAWWTLRYFGHGEVRVLDGGYRAWAAVGYPVETGEPGGPPGPPGDFTAVPGRMPVLDADGAARFARAGVLLDSRAEERYRGEVEPVDPVAGHIPGAISAPAADNTCSDGRFLGPAELRARFASLGVSTGGGPGSGVAFSPGSGSAGDPGTEIASSPGSGSGGDPGSGARVGAGGGAGGSMPDVGGDDDVWARGAATPLAGAYCGSGVVAAQEVLALGLTGIPAALYVGSWSEWITDPARPVATGAERG